MFWQLELQGRIFSSRNANALVYSLWSLLPSFCNYPVDTTQSFNDLKRSLCSALNEEPDTHGIICSSLQILIQQNKNILEGKREMPDIEEGIATQRAVAHYTLQIVEDNLSVLKSSARELLTVLSRILTQSTKDNGASLQVRKPSQSIENAATMLLICWNIGSIFSCLPKFILFILFCLFVHAYIPTYPLFIYLLRSFKVNASAFLPSPEVGYSKDRQLNYEKMYFMFSEKL